MAHLADPRIESERIFVFAVGIGLFDAALLWVMYMALEPSVRRFWPDTLLGWSRLVSGKLRDPRVGRDFLYGAVAGLGIAALSLTQSVILPVLGQPPPVPQPCDVDMLMGISAALGDMLLLTINALQSAGVTLFLLVVMRMLLRSWLAATVVAVVFFMLLNAAQFSGSATLVFDVVFSAGIIIMLVAIVVRLGLLASIVTFYCFQLLNAVPLTASLGAWHARPTIVALLLTLVFVLGGFYLARGGAPLFGRTFLEE